jgi:hypothetical protein
VVINQELLIAHRQLTGKGGATKAEIIVPCNVTGILSHKSTIDFEK